MLHWGQLWIGRLSERFGFDCTMFEGWFSLVWRISLTRAWRWDLFGGHAGPYRQASWRLHDREYELMHLCRRQMILGLLLGMCSRDCIYSSKI